MQIIDLQHTSLQTALDHTTAVLQAGGLVVYPTETTYGLGADATNPSAVQKLLQYKTHRQDKPLSVLVSDASMAARYAELNATAQQAYRTWLPGPVTIVAVGRHILAPGVESHGGTLGLRQSSHPLAQALVTHFGRPITATGANASNQKRPYTIDDLLSPLSAKQKALLDVVIDAGTLPPNPPSTVLDTTLDSYQILRQGELALPVVDTWDTHSPADTIDLGMRLAQRYRNDYGHRPVIFALEGDMGAGKTHFTKGLAFGLGITDLITSPSYTLMHEYSFLAEGQEWPFLHIDAWRLPTAEALAVLDLPHYLTHKAVLSLEWANTQTEWLMSLPYNPRVVWLRWQIGDDDHRTITLQQAPPSHSGRTVTPPRPNNPPRPTNPPHTTTPPRPDNPERPV